jgi:L-ascorbate metabolism protein UlaG (beta-lactamase superfamily)
MEETLKYLKPNVVIEPLFDRWYAWSHLISPATAAMNITGRHLKIMNSYIQAPQIHATAVKNPKMRGGPFMDYEGEKVEAIAAMRTHTLQHQKKLIALSEAIKDLSKLLKTRAKGYSLEPLYAEVPDILKGYVELVYDLNHYPSFRLYEHLLYKSPFYNEQAQSICLWETLNDERPFVLSTPRLESEKHLHLDVPFRHSIIDVMARMKRTPGSVNEIKRQLGLKNAQESLFESFFTREAPPAYKRYQGDKIRMRYFGHACILIETKDISILVDPLISYYGYHSAVSHFSDVDLPGEIDFVLITHNHQDHILFETLLPLRHKIKNLIIPAGGNGSLQDPNLKLMFTMIGFKNVIEIEEMETLSFDHCNITGIPFIGEHSDLSISTKSCYLVTFRGLSVMFMADSCNVEPRLYELIQREVGSVDVLFLGMECDGAPLTWLYGPLLTEDFPRDKDNSRRLAGSNFERGKPLVDIFNPREVYVYAMGQEPWVEFISSIKYTDESNPIVASNKLIEYVKEKGSVAERLYGEKELLYEGTQIPARALSEV